MKRRYGIVLGIFLLCLAICTYVSFQVYQANLPVVRTDSAVSSALRYDWTLTGSIHHKTPVSISLPVPAKILQRSAQPGQWVKTGVPLLQLDPAFLHLQWLQCKADEETLLQKIEESTSYEKQILELRKAELQETIAFLEQLQLDEGWVKASTDGVVLYAADYSAAANVPLITIGSDSGEKQLAFSLTEEQLAYCKIGTKIKAEVVIAAEKTTLDIHINQVFYDASAQSYRCFATTNDALDMMEGQPVTAHLRATSKEYETVIPVSAIVESENGNASFYVLREKRTVMGTQYYAVLQSAYILEQNDSFAALSAPVTEPVISYWTKPLSNNAGVCVLS